MFFGVKITEKCNDMNIKRIKQCLDSEKKGKNFIEISFFWYLSRTNFFLIVDKSIFLRKKY